jgi:hypothetical protein
MGMGFIDSDSVMARGNGGTSISLQDDYSTWWGTQAGEVFQSFSVLALNLTYEAA